MKRTFLFILSLSFLLLISVSGCDLFGGSDDSGNSCPDDVSGEYTFITDDIKCTCSDGYSETFSPVSMRLEVNQDDNWLTFINVSSGGTPGIDVIEGTNMEGALESDCDFVTKQQLIVTMDGISGNITVDYTLDGKFTDNGWKGAYVWIFNPHDILGSCTYKTNFHGSRSTASSLTNELQSSEIETDVFDDGHISIEEMLGRLLGY